MMTVLPAPSLTATSDVGSMIKFSSVDHQYMALALQHACKGQYTTHPNPAVGCVLVKNSEIVGQGWHHQAGQPHAEILALQQAGEAAAGATAYITLEPCSHQGRTPPCADALLDAGIYRVIAAVEDPNPRVDGAGLNLLRSAGVTVETGLLAASAQEINRGFFKRMSRGIPWVTIKLAASVDARTAMANGESQWITGAAARQDVQRLRAGYAAILTGVETVLSDDPRLTQRYLKDGRQPIRVVLDTHLRTPVDARLFSQEGEVWILTAATDSDRIQQLQKQGALVMQVPTQGSHLQLQAVLQLLAEREVNSVLVEAGATLAGAFISANQMDELIVYLAPKLLGSRARGLLQLPDLVHLRDAPALHWYDTRMVGEDLRLILRRSR